KAEPRLRRNAMRFSGSAVRDVATSLGELLPRFQLRPCVTSFLISASGRLCLPWARAFRSAMMASKGEAYDVGGRDAKPSSNVAAPRVQVPSQLNLGALARIRPESGKRNPRAPWWPSCHLA